METEASTRGVRREVSRRRFIGGSAAALGAAAWARIDRVGAADLLNCVTPPGFPAGIELTKQRFENWSGEIVIDQIWTATATSPADIVTLANWAHGAGYKLRARGYMHNWSPLVVTAQDSCEDQVVLVDARALDGMAMTGDSPPAVRVGTGQSMQELLRFLHEHGRGLASVPAIGLVTVGGALAIDAHGAVTPAAGEVPATGEGFGSISNLVLELTAVVWDAGANAYVLRTFDRTDPETPALSAHLGRAFLTEAVIRTAPARNLRCQSVFGTTVDELFAAPPAAPAPNPIRRLLNLVKQVLNPQTVSGETFSDLLDRAGRVEAIWFPYTDKPWTKIWSVAPTRPLLARPTSRPYNYPFSDSLPNEVNELVDQLITGPGPFNSLGDDFIAPLDELVDRVLSGEATATPLLGQASYQVASLGTLALLARDLWGPAWHTQLYIKWTTLRYAQVGFVILTPRAGVQQALHDLTTRYASMLDAYKAQGLYPVNGAVEIRCTALDDPAASAVPGAVPPTLSALRPVADQPSWDTAIWVNVLTFPGTEGSYEFLTELEQWARGHFTAPTAGLRVEWSKGWAYSGTGPWTDATTVTTTIPDGFRGAAVSGDDWDDARATLNALDPHRIYSNDFLDQLLP